MHMCMCMHMSHVLRSDMLLAVFLCAYPIALSWHVTPRYVAFTYFTGAVLSAVTSPPLPPIARSLGTWRGLSPLCCRPRLG